MVDMLVLETNEVKSRVGSTPTWGTKKGELI